MKNQNNKIEELNSKIKDALVSTEPDCSSFVEPHMGKNFEEEVTRRCGDIVNIDRGIMKKFLCLMWTSPIIPPETYYSVYHAIDGKDFIDIKSQEIDYKNIINNCKHITNCITKPKYNLIVPVRNRKDHLDTFVKNTLNLFGKNKDWCLTLIFQEDSETSFNRASELISLFPQIHVINMPHNHEFVSKYGDHMNRSLCYNVASLIVECDFQINHDVDLLFGQNFIDNIERKTKEDSFKWLQPYRGSRVIMLSKDETDLMKKEIQKGKSVSTQNIVIPELRNTPYSFGSTGGSVVIRHSVFREIGGYDPELVWGYAPEDIIFWLKLEIFFKTYNKTNILKLEPFCATDVFSHDTDVELLHMFHPPTEVDKRYPYFPLFIANWLMNIASEVDHMKWLEVSREKYEQFHNNDVGV